MSGTYPTGNLLSLSIKWTWRYSSACFVGLRTGVGEVIEQVKACFFPVSLAVSKGVCLDHFPFSFSERQYSELQRGRVTVLSWTWKLLPRRDLGTEVLGFASSIWVVEDFLIFLTLLGSPGSGRTWRKKGRHLKYFFLQKWKNTLRKKGVF